MSDGSASAPRKRSVTIAGHATSVSMEEGFWRRLGLIAAGRNLSVNALIAEIDRSRKGNLSSAIRVWILENAATPATAPAAGDPFPVVVRPVGPGDRKAVDQVVEAAFGRPDEAALVRRLAADGDILVERLACSGEAAIGHIAFSRQQLAAGPARKPAAALAPLAVVPDRQRHGVGAALVHAGIEACRGRSVDLITVLGDPAYYRRFGFCDSAAQALDAPFSGPAFMALALDGAAPGAGPWTVRYAPAFGLDAAPD